jgi:hypothetical protein
MHIDAEARWALAVRALALTSALLLVVAVLEARTVREARSELQQLRAEREQVKAGISSAWAAQSRNEAAQAIRWLDDFYRDEAEGFGMSGGLCAGGHVHEDVIVAQVMGVFLPARASGKSVDNALTLMKDGLEQTDAYRAAHGR